jgi:very-short-patch-repair endonuclease
VTTKWEPSDPDDLIERYRSGESVNALAKICGASRPTLTKFLSALPDYRGAGDANRLMASNRTTEQNTAWSAAARTARRGQTEGPEARRRRAIARQRQTWQIGRGEQQLVDWLQRRGMSTRQQFPVNGYNIDIAVGPVAVELLVSPHRPTAMAKVRKRVKNLTDCGWHVLYVWVKDADTLVERVADDIVAFVELSERNPSPVGQYRMVWGAA